MARTDRPRSLRAEAFTAKAGEESYMKKRVFFAAIFCAAARLLALDVDFAIGARAGMDVNLFDFGCGDWTGDSKLASGFGGNVFVNIALSSAQGFSVQPEVGIHYHNIKIDRTTSDRDFNFTTLEVPVLAAYTFHLNEIFILQPEAGPRLSFLLGKIGGDDEYDVKTPLTFGVEAGLTFGVKTGPGHILVCARYGRDFTRIAVDRTLRHTKNGDKIGAAQSFGISLGYRMQLF